MDFLAGLGHSETETAAIPPNNSLTREHQAHTHEETQRHTLTKETQRETHRDTYSETH